MAITPICGSLVTRDPAPLRPRWATSKSFEYKPRLLRSLAEIELLVLDDWGLTPLPASAARAMWELLDDRSRAHTTIMASQLRLDHGHGTIGDPSVADAILNHLVHAAYWIILKVESLRKQAPPATASTAGSES